MEALLHWTGAPIQLQVQTKDALLQPGMGKWKYSLTCTCGPRARAHSHLDMALGNKSPLHALGGSCFPLGKRVGEKLANSALGDWDMAPNLKGGISRASRL